MDSILEKNKAAVFRFNKEVIEKGDETAFQSLMDPEFINRTAPLGAPAGPESMIHFFNKILRPGFPDLKVTIHDQIAEGDRVTTRKSFQGTHRGEFMGIPPTGRIVVFEVIDIVRLRNGRYLEHWGMNNIQAVVASLSGK